MAFFGLIVCSYLFSNEAGEKVCARAEFEEVLLGGILATSIVAMLAALTWLLVAFERRGGHVVNLLIQLIFFAVVLTALLLWTSSTSFIAADRPGHTYWMSDISMLAISVITVVAIRKRIKTHPTTASAPTADQSDKAVQRFIRWAYINLTATAFAIGIAISWRPEHWTPPSNWLVFPAGWASLLIPLALVFQIVPALAPSDPPEKPVAQIPVQTTTASQQATSQGSTGP